MRAAPERAPQNAGIVAEAAMNSRRVNVIDKTVHDPDNRMYMQATPKRDFLHYTLATLAYRGGKVLRGAPEGVAQFRAGEGTRTPVEILAHIGDLFDWALSLAEGKHEWHDSQPLAWDREVERFYRLISAFDARLASDRPLGFPEEKLFQGPIADALTHFGQIAMLCRMAGAPVRGENYFRAEIVAGRVGVEQAAPVREFE